MLLNYVNYKCLLARTYVNTSLLFAFYTANVVRWLNKLCKTKEQKSKENIQWEKQYTDINYLTDNLLMKKKR